MSENRLPDYLDHIQQAAADARSFSFIDLARHVPRSGKAAQMSRTMAEGVDNPK